VKNGFGSRKSQIILFFQRNGNPVGKSISQCCFWCRFVFQAMSARCLHTLASLFFRKWIIVQWRSEIYFSGIKDTFKVVVYNTYCLTISAWISRVFPHLEYHTVWLLTESGCLQPSVCIEDQATTNHKNVSFDSIKPTGFIVHPGCDQCPSLRVYGFKRWAVGIMSVVANQNC